MEFLGKDGQNQSKYLGKENKLKKFLRGGTVNSAQAQEVGWEKGENFSMIKQTFYGIPRGLVTFYAIIWSKHFNGILQGIFLKSIYSWIIGVQLRNAMIR